MFSKEERKALHEEFWDDFKRFINKESNAEGKRIKWLRYPTKVKEIYVRLHIDSKLATFSIDIQAKDEGIRALIWEQFTELKVVLENEMGTDGYWKEIAYNDAGQAISQIKWTLEDLSIYNKNDRDKAFNFFRKHLLSFDQFYCEYADILINLAN